MLKPWVVLTSTFNGLDDLLSMAENRPGDDMRYKKWGASSQCFSDRGMVI